MREINSLLSAIVSVTFSLLSLRMTGGDEYALYPASRRIALPLGLLYAKDQALARRHRGSAVAMTLVQLLDGFIGSHLRDPSRAYRPIAFAAINLGLLMWMH